MEAYNFSGTDHNTVPSTTDNWKNWQSCSVAYHNTIPYSTLLTIGSTGTVAQEQYSRVRTRMTFFGEKVAENAKIGG